MFIIIYNIVVLNLTKPNLDVQLKGSNIVVLDSLVILVSIVLIIYM